MLQYYKKIKLQDIFQIEFLKEQNYLNATSFTNLTKDHKCNKSSMHSTNSKQEHRSLNQIKKNADS